MNYSKKLYSRIIGSVCAASVLVAGCPSVLAAVTVSGDANDDRSYNLSDIGIAKKAVLSASALSAQGFENADMDADGGYNAVDLCILMRGIVKPAEIVTGDNFVTGIVYSSGSVKLTNANGETVSASDAVNVNVTDNTYVEVTQPGEYDLSGSCSEGQFKVNVDKTAYVEGQVTANLLGLTLSSTGTSPIYVASIDDEFVLKVKKDNTNTISDGTQYTNEDVSSAAVFSCDDMKIKGNGTLTVNGNCDEGIACKNDLKIWNSTLNVNAVGDGIRGKDSLRIGDPDATDYSGRVLTVKSNTGDGIKSTNAEDADSGFVRINGGSVNINAYCDGIQGEQAVEIIGGTMDIYTYQGSAYTGTGGNTGGWGGMQEGNSNKPENSAKGIKAIGLYDTDGTTYLSAGDLTISGGNITIDSSDDSLHCAGGMNVVGGTLKLSSADDGLHSDSDLVIGTSGSSDYNSPVIDVVKSYEGVEGMNITVNSGSINVNSTDDGFNAAGGADGSGSWNPGGWNPGGMGGTSSGSYLLTFNGGYVYAATSGDGLDSNGDLVFNGGYIFVSQTGNGNGPLDCGDSNNKITYNGGCVFAAGSSGMFESPSKYSFLGSSSVSAGQSVTFVNGSGTVIATCTLVKASSRMVFSCSDSSVTCYTGGTLNGTTYFTQSAGNNGKAGFGGTINGGTAVSAGGNTNPWG